MSYFLFLKGRQLASLDKEAVCFDDQEDQCSGYSPSFFHFKPTTKNYKTALWGGMFSLTKTKSSTLAIYLAFCINQITNIVVACLKTKILVFFCVWLDLKIDGNLYTTLEPTVSTINPNVFFHRNDFHSGMIYWERPSMRASKRNWYRRIYDNYR